MLVACASPALASGATRLSIEPGGAVLDQGSAFDVVGALSSADGAGVGGRNVTLLQDRFPYDRFRPLREAATDDAGRYRFDDVVPQVNTRYVTRVADPEVKARSRTVRAVVEPQSQFGITEQGDGFVRTEAVYTVAPVSPLSYFGGRAFFYFRKVGRPRFVVKDASGLRVRRRGGALEISSRGELPLSEGDYRFQVSFCIRPPRGGFPVGQGPLGPRPLDSCPRSFRPNELSD